jgi:glycosyltransferase involved in cell wall biosynthesis
MEMKNIYLQHDVFLFTSIRDSFGGQVFEAMACSLPVIALNQGGVKSLLPEGSLFKVSLNDPDTIATEISTELKHLWKDEKLRIQKGTEAFNYALTESWSARARRLEVYYEQILEEKKL